MLNEEAKDIVDVTIVLNIWKRKYLEKQLKALEGQTVIPKEIWVIHYEEHVQVKDLVAMFSDKFPSITIIESTKNLKYFGRFSIAVNIETEFTWVLDDDVIPGTRWLANCCYKCSTLNAIITCTGRIIPKDDFQPENPRNFNPDYFIGDILQHKEDMCYLTKDQVVDYACQSYFFKTAWLRAFWSIWPTTFACGEDIHLCASCKSQLNIDTVVLAQPDIRNSGNISKRYGADDFATWKKTDFLSTREKVIRYHMEQYNWKPLEWQATSKETVALVHTD